jgi:hypothetical protein
MLALALYFGKQELKTYIEWGQELSDESVDNLFCTRVWDGRVLSVGETLHRTTASIYFGWSNTSDRI